MQTGAVIVAAGMSSRMGDFKPMLNIGSITIAQRIVANFRQAGVDRIVIITGYNAEALERHLAGAGIVFLRNEEYESTEMFDSAKIGLEYISDKADRILFTPVDIPLFTADTVKRLIDTKCELGGPSYKGKIGHPIVMSSTVAKELIGFTGDGGLKGAMDNCGIPMKKIEVADKGILHDADTPEDYETLLLLHNSQLIRPEISISLTREKPFFDEKMCMLLELVDETGSVRAACKRMQISYSTGWNIIRTLEEQLARSLISRTQGGAQGGRSTLTEDGQRLMEKYKSFSSELKEEAQRLFEKHLAEELSD